MTTLRHKKELDIRDCRPLYQVKVALDSQGGPTVAAVEMLTRGTARVGSVGAGSAEFELPRDFPKFIEALKSEELLNSWTTWVVSSAVQTLNVLPASISLAINIDPRELSTRGFYATLKDGIPESDRGRVTLELTEQSPIPDDSNGKTILSNLVQLGFRLSIDDFCKIPKSTVTGIPLEERAYSHVYYLATLPVSEVKVDMSCAQTITQMVGHPVEELMHWICSLPKFKEGLVVVVEGVEADFPSSFLKKYYATPNVLFQGYAYSRNIELKELLEHPYMPR